ncbi:MAG: DNA polymerase III subunit alpha [Chroococcopsis gigantea SAG 12.99]|jgi:DNA polymerase-3 subunit alpha|nr:trans-splicing intein-formed DNA polymerase III subunit alpha C-terminal partner DnaE-C [Chlorogloea purpurea SAG 13.99]MDV2999151.1 DNA polymerase III subunit alpha [Chroococcopsis gigantea SAG 12.99]
MVKIVSRKSLGVQPVYDLGVAGDHNFLLANGLVASNCFNKSHSTAYAYVTYQTAYLKANYPVEYMTALLTASSDNQDKVEKYRENCQKMGIQVLPPDINRSQKHFTPGEKTILFGLSAVRNLGENAIEIIINAREAAGGSFKSLGDFCSRVDLRTVNKRALETLILSGAFDRLQPNRRQLMNDSELIISWAQKRTKEKESGQMNLFDFVGNHLGGDGKESEFEQEPKSPPVPDYSIQEKLKLEKEHLGFYVSEHPLTAIHQAARLLSPINIGQLDEYKERKPVSAIVVIIAVKKIVTQKGTPMAFLTLEDASGQSEAVVFTDAYQKIQSLLVEEAQLMVWGKVDKRKDRDKAQLIIEDAELVDDLKLIMIDLPLEFAVDPVKQNNLRGILQEHSGEKVQSLVPVIAVIHGDNSRQFVRLGQKYWVQDADSTANSLQSAGFNAYVKTLLTK